MGRSAGRLRRHIIPTCEVVGQIDQGDDLPSVIGQGRCRHRFQLAQRDARHRRALRGHKKAMVIGTTGHSDEGKSADRAIANPQIPIVLVVELLDRREHAVLADAQGGGNSGAGLRSGSRRDASSPEDATRRAARRRRWRKFWPPCASSSLRKSRATAASASWANAPPRKSACIRCAAAMWWATTR